MILTSEGSNWVSNLVRKRECLCVAVLAGSCRGGIFESLTCLEVSGHLARESFSFTPPAVSHNFLALSLSSACPSHVIRSLAISLTLGGIFEYVARLRNQTNWKLKKKLGAGQARIFHCRFPNRKASRLGGVAVMWVGSNSVRANPSMWLEFGGGRSTNGHCNKKGRRGQ